MSRASLSGSERSRKAFERAQPETWARLAAIGDPLSKRVEDDGQSVNIDLGSGVLYPQAEPIWSINQLGEFRSNPERLGFSNPNHCNLSDSSFKLLNRIVSYVRQHGLTEEMEGLPVVDIGYLFVFGVGLGRHIPELIEQTPAKHVVLIEPMAEFLLHAIDAIDWCQVFEVAERRGVTLHFVLAETPEQISRRIEQLVSREGNTFLDGSYFFRHYYSWVLEQSYTLIQERLKGHYISSGFLEDEIEMVRNCAGNLRRWPHHLVGSKPHREQNLPVFLVGAGPSLDNDMEHVRRLRDRVIVVSCGTALGVLLKNGIRPDLHCELERGELVYTLLSEVRDEFGFEGITLVASTTVDPRVSGLFDRCWFFFRNGLSPTTVLKSSATPLTGADPLVCNAAFSVVTSLGFRQIYLFGIDLGQKQDGRHHAKDSIYYKDDHTDLDELYRKRFDRVVPGNFGGTVTTFWAYDLGRQMLDQVQRLRRSNLVNCSDGARIYGATPKVAAAVTLPEHLVPRSTVLAQLEKQMRFCQAGELLVEVDLRPHIDGCEAFIDAFSAFIADLRSDSGGFSDAEFRLLGFVTERRPEFRGFFALSLSSIVSMLRLGSFFGSRLRTNAGRQSFFQHFLGEYLERCIEMAEISKQVFSEVEREQADSIEPFRLADRAGSQRDRREREGVNACRSSPTPAGAADPARRERRSCVVHRS